MCVRVCLRAPSQLLDSGDAVGYSFGGSSGLSGRLAKQADPKPTPPNRTPRRHTVKILRSNCSWIATNMAALYHIAILFVIRTILFVLRTTCLQLQTRSYEQCLRKSSFVITNNCFVIQCCHFLRKVFSVHPARLHVNPAIPTPPYPTRPVR